MPTRYGPWWRVNALFKTWQRIGAWAQIEATLQSQADAEGKLDWDLAVGSTTSRAHVHHAGYREARLVGDPTTALRDALDTVLHRNRGESAGQQAEDGEVLRLAHRELQPVDSQ